MSSSRSCGAGADYVPQDVKGGGLLVQLSIESESRSQYTLPYMDSMSVFLLISDNQYEGTHESLAVSSSEPEASKFTDSHTKSCS
jgi:hypothetical protein